MISLATADSALKDVYLGVVSDQLNTSINPLLARIKQTTTDVWGKEIVKLAPFGLNGGIGAGSETGTLPTAGGNNYCQFRLDLKNLYGKIEISDKAIRASQSSAGAFVNLLNAEMEGLVKASSYNFGRMLYGNGDGALAIVQGNEASVSGTTTFKVDSTAALVEGMVVDIVEDSGTPLLISGAQQLKLKIVVVDRANKTVTLQTTKTYAKDASIAEEGCTHRLYVQGSMGKELTGLGKIFDTTQETLYGVERAQNHWMNPYSISIASGNTMGNLSDISMQAVVDHLADGFDSNVDFIVGSSGVKRNYQYYLTSYRSNIDVMNLKGGYKAISFNGVPFVSDRFAPQNTVYMLNTAEFNLHQLCDWKWLEGEDGRVLKQSANSPTYTATLVKYADMICNKPCGQARIEGVAELSSMPA